MARKPVPKPTISGVVLSYARQKNLPAIIKGMLDSGVIDDCAIWHNGPTLLHVESLRLSSAHSRRVQITNCPDNHYTYGRFRAMVSCGLQHDAIATCDDDNLVHNWPEIADSFRQNRDRITACLRAPGHLELDKKMRWGAAHEVLLGWGAMFDRRRIADTLGRYRMTYGIDEVLLRKADRIFSIMLGTGHEVLSAKFTELPGATDVNIALYARPDHNSLTEIARRRALDLIGIRPQGKVMV